MKPILSALLLLCAAAAVLAETCPAQEDIAPCTCQQGLDSHRDIDIQCNGHDNPEAQKLDFKAHFANLHGKKVGSLLLYDIPFKRVPSDLFKGMHVRRLTFQNCELEALADEDDDLPLQGLEDSLENLTIDECFEGANQLKHLKVSHLKKLKELHVFDNDVPEVPNEWFQDGPASLEDVTFIRCQVKKVGDKAFAALPNLEIIEFSDNKIAQVGRSMVARPAKKLESIMLYAIVRSKLQKNPPTGPSYHRTSVNEHLILTNAKHTGAPTNGDLIMRHRNIVNRGRHTPERSQRRIHSPERRQPGTSHAGNPRRQPRTSHTRNPSRNRGLHTPEIHAAIEDFTHQKSKPQPRTSHTRNPRLNQGHDTPEIRAVNRGLHIPEIQAATEDFTHQKSKSQPRTSHTRNPSRNRGLYTPEIQAATEDFTHLKSKPQPRTSHT